MATKPDGDPAAMQALAARLRRIASTLAAAPRPAVDGWRSPAARRVRSTLDGTATAADRIAADLSACAARLDRAADRVAAAQAVAARRPAMSVSTAPGAARASRAEARS